MHRLCALCLALVTIAGCGSETTRAVPPTGPAVEPPTAREAEPQSDDPATTAVAEECERDSDCIAYVGVCESWFVVAAGREAAHEAAMRESMEIDAMPCPLLDPNAPGPRPEVVCEHGRCERAD